MTGDNYTLKEVVEQLRNEVRWFSKLLRDIVVKLESLSDTYVRKEEMTKEVLKLEKMINERDIRANELMEYRDQERRDFEGKINSRVSRFLKIVWGVMILAILWLILKWSWGLP